MKFLQTKLFEGSSYRFLLHSCRVPFLLFLILMLSGCGVIGTVAVDQKHAALMPQPVAEAIVKKYSDDWSIKPYVWSVGVFCKKRKVYVEYSKINGAVYIHKKNQLLLTSLWLNGNPQCNGRVYFYNLGEDQAMEFVSALRTLGAKIGRLWVDRQG